MCHRGPAGCDGGLSSEQHDCDENGVPPINNNVSHLDEENLFISFYPRHKNATIVKGMVEICY